MARSLGPRYLFPRESLLGNTPPERHRGAEYNYENVFEIKAKQITQSVDVNYNKTSVK